MGSIIAIVGRGTRELYDEAVKRIIVAASKAYGIPAFAAPNFSRYTLKFCVAAELRFLVLVFGA